MNAPLHRQPASIAVVAAGGALGALSRYAVAHAFPASPGRWPWATFSVNVVGAFVLGLLLEALTRRGPDVGSRRRLRLFLGTGFCGAFTTYSTFAHDVDTLGVWGRGAGWALLQVVTGLLAAGLGAWLGARTVPAVSHDEGAQR